MQEIKKIETLLHALSEGSQEAQVGSKGITGISCFSEKEKDALLKEACAWRKANNARAEELFVFLCTIDPHNAYYWTELGILKMHKQAYDSALQAFGIASALSLTAPLPYLLSAAAYARSGRTEHINSCLEMCMELSKNDIIHKDLYEIASQCYENNGALHHVSSLFTTYTVTGGMGA